MRRVQLFLPFFVFVSLFFFAEKHSAQAQVCKTKDSQTALQYLRRLTLDLMGRVPTHQELLEVIRSQKVTEPIIDKMLNSNDFLVQIRAYHRDALWANISNRRFVSAAWVLTGDGKKVPFQFAGQSRKRRFRGAKIGCLNEPAKFDSNGKIQTKCRTLTAENGTKLQACQEGYVMIRPYWDQKKQYKACAFDAQTNLTVPKAGGGHYDCSGSGSFRSAQCACGPNLRWCLSKKVEKLIATSLNEQVFRYIDDIVKNNRPYTEIITGKKLEVNGPLSHWLQHQHGAAGNLTYVSKEQNMKVPIVPYADKNKWVATTRGKLHSGILTMAGYLLKFDSNRSRANRFYNAFLCKHFQAPAGGLPPANDNCHEEPNLMKRCGCKYCHVGVEPAAAYWGRWAESGLAPLNPSEFPSFLQQCKPKPGKKASALCRKLYFTGSGNKKEDAYQGYLRAYLFATKDMQDNIEQGPALLAKLSIKEGDFANCTTRKIWSWFVGKPPSHVQKTLVDSISLQFKKDKYDLRLLVRRIVMSDEYRLGRLLNR